MGEAYSLLVMRTSELVLQTHPYTRTPDGRSDLILAHTAEPDDIQSLELVSRRLGSRRSISWPMGT